MDEEQEARKEGEKEEEKKKKRKRLRFHGILELRAGDLFLMIARLVSIICSESPKA